MMWGWDPCGRPGGAMPLSAVLDSPVTTLPPLGSSSASSAASMPARYVENISHLSQKHEVQNLPITHFRDKFTLFPIHFPGIIRIDVGAQFIAPWDASILHNDVVEYTYRRAYL